MTFCDGSGISWTIYKQSAPRSTQITTPTPHHSIFAGRMLFLMPNQQCQSTKSKSIWLNSPVKSTQSCCEEGRIHGTYPLADWRPGRLSATVFHQETTDHQICWHRRHFSLSAHNTSVTVAKSFLQRPLLGDRRHIVSVCFPVSVGRLEHECYELTIKSSVYFSSFSFRCCTCLCGWTVEWPCCLITFHV